MQPGVVLRSRVGSAGTPSDPSPLLSSLAVALSTAAHGLGRLDAPQHFCRPAASGGHCGGAFSIASARRSPPLPLVVKRFHASTKTLNVVGADPSTLPMRSACPRHAAMISTRQHGHRPRSSKHPCAGPADGTVRRRAHSCSHSLQHQHPLSEQSRSLCAAVRSHAREFHRTRAAASRACGCIGSALCRPHFTRSVGALQAFHATTRSCRSCFCLLRLQTAPVRAKCGRTIGVSGTGHRLRWTGSCVWVVCDTRRQGGGSHVHDVHVPQGQKKQCEV